MTIYRSHVTRTPIVAALRNVNPMDRTIPGNLWKPRGLWYSVNGGWQKWCAVNQPDWLEGRYVYGLDTADCNLLQLAHEAAIARFHEAYTTPIDPALPHLTTPDWARLAAEGYDGVEILSYHYSDLRYELPYMWYYAWDCPSGCLWNAARARLTLLVEPSHG